MIEFDFEALRNIGLTQATVNQLSNLPDPAPGARLMRLTELQRDWIPVHDGQQEYVARVLPRLVHALQEKILSLSVGDWVIVEANEGGELWIADLLPPATHIARRANDGRRQSLASNVDTALLVMGLDHDFNLRRMERYIAMVQAAEVAPVVVLTKMDIGVDIDQKLAEVELRLPRSVPVVAVNGLDAASCEQLAPWLGSGQTLVLLGSSGTGKSTLTNTLTGRLEQDTGGIRKGDGRGRHTTTARSLHRCAAGACIIDTPGLRTWSPDADAATLAATFEDIAALAQHCQFRDCHHEAEPGCAVREHIDPDRLLNYHKLLRDVARGEMTALQRIEVRSKWKALGKAGTARARDKRSL